MTQTSVAGRDEVLSFTVAEERLALPAAEVAEIIRLPPVTRLPLGPASLLGLINLRGTVLPVVSLARLMGRVAATPGASSRVVVMSKAPPIGLLVDAVRALAPATNERRIDLDEMLAQDFMRLTRRGGMPQGGGHSNGALTVAAPAAASSGATPTVVRQTMALVGFTLAGQTYAVKLDLVVEVTVLPAAIAAVPHTDEAMLGVVGYRLGLLPLVSLRVLLGLPADALDPAHTRVVVIRLGAALVGLVVDAMQAILRIDAAAVDPVPLVLTRGAGEARIAAIARVDVDGGGQRLVAILSPDGLFDDATAARILAAAQQGRAPGDAADGATTTAGAEGAVPAAAEGAATVSASDRHGSRPEQFVIFQLGGEHYGVPIAAVDEVVRRPDSLTRVPRAPAFVEGVMSLRGRIVPVIDQAQRFAAGGGGASSRRIVVMTVQAEAADDPTVSGHAGNRLQAGFVVDAVSEVLAITAEELSAAPALAADGAAVFDRVATIARDGRMILVINPRALLDGTERAMLAGIAARAREAAGFATASLDASDAAASA